jgi:hypothetical protein
MRVNRQSNIASFTFVQVHSPNPAHNRQRRKQGGRSLLKYFSEVGDALRGHTKNMDAAPSGALRQGLRFIHVNPAVGNEMHMQPVLTLVLCCDRQ